MTVWRPIRDAELNAYIRMLAERAQSMGRADSRGESAETPSPPRMSSPARVLTARRTATGTSLVRGEISPVHWRWSPSGSTSIAATATPRQAEGQE
jgi:hypothetical protein